MARKKPLYFQGDRCTSDCSGHAAGYAYSLSGGTQYNRSSPSFTNGMRIAEGKQPFATGRARRKK